MRLGRRQQGYIPLELGADSLETAGFELQEAGALDQAASRLEAVPAMDGVVAEVSHKAQAEKHNRDCRSFDRRSLFG